MLNPSHDKRLLRHTGVAQNASYGDIKRAWRAKARQWHPDIFSTADEKLAAHKQFVEIVEAYSVLIDAKQRAAYDRLVAAGASAAYAGYENAVPEEDRQEAADWFQKILNETPSEFWRTTVFLLVISPVSLILWLGLMGIIVAIYQVFTGQSSLGWGGSALLIVLFFPHLFVSIIGLLILKDLYLRLKRIMMWIKIRTRIKRLFPALFKGKPGRAMTARQ